MADERARIAKLEAVVRQTANILRTWATAETGSSRDRIMTVANRLNAVIGRSQSTHGRQYDEAGKVIER